MLHSLARSFHWWRFVDKMQFDSIIIHFAQSETIHSDVLQTFRESVGKKTAKQDSQTRQHT